MTTDPTPHTERAAAAAAELHTDYSDEWFSQQPTTLQEAVRPEYNFACEKRARMAAIIAKHFNDDALRLAAGRALERLKEDLEQHTRLQLVLKKFGPDSKSRAYANEIKSIITALSAALAGEQMGKET